MPNTTPIAITVNGASRQIDDQTPLTAVLAEMGIDTVSSKGVAVAVDDLLVRRTNWGSCILHDGARVEIVTAKQGG